MSLATTLLKTALKEKLKQELNDELREKFFPPSLEDQILTEVRQIAKTLEEVKNEVARIRIQPSVQAFNEEVDYYLHTIIPGIKRELANKNPNSKAILELANAGRDHCIIFRGKIFNSWTVISEKSDSCDFAVRRLFQVTRNMCSLYLAMLTWTWCLYDRLNNNKANECKDYINACLDDVPTKCSDFASKLAQARKSKIITIYNVEKPYTYYDRDRGVSVLTSKKVYCIYEDTFSSTEESDPFKCSTFSYKIDKENTFWNPFSPSGASMASALSQADNYMGQAQTYRETVMNLINENIIDPNSSFLKDWNSAVAELSIK